MVTDNPLVSVIHYSSLWRNVFPEFWCPKYSIPPATTRDSPLFSFLKFICSSHQGSTRKILIFTFSGGLTISTSHQIVKAASAVAAMLISNQHLHISVQYSVTSWFINEWTTRCGCMWRTTLQGLCVLHVPGVPEYNCTSGRGMPGEGEWLACSASTIHVKPAFYFHHHPSLHT